MGTKLIEFSDGILVEVGVQRDQKQEMSAAGAERLTRNFSVLSDMVRKLAGPVQNAFSSFAAEGIAPFGVNSAEVELGLGFTAEGNFFVSKAACEASLAIKICFKRIKEAEETE